jgi:uncharacterized protein YdhG (YjbR/CyaY superfamily)
VTVDEYLDAAPEPHGRTLRGLRAMLASILPDGQEGMSYGVPAVRVDGTPVAGYAHAKNHCSYFPHSGSVLNLGGARVAGGLLLGQGQLRFPIDQLPDEQLIRRLVALRVAMLSGSP